MIIGFPDFAHYQKGIIDKFLVDDWNYFDRQVLEMWGTVPRIRYNLWRFLKFKKRDIVIVPRKGTFSVCKIVDERPLLIHETYSNDLKTWGNKKVTSNGVHLISEYGNAYDLAFARKVRSIIFQFQKAKLG